MSDVPFVMAGGDRVYQYDGSLAGFYTCVQVCVHARHVPLGIRAENEDQLNLLPCQQVITDLAQAARVREAITRRVSARALELCEHVFLSCLAEKELIILRFLILGFGMGSHVVHDLTNPIVHVMLKAEKHLLGEVHLFCGFVRFSDQDGRLIAAISPKNYVLPLLAPHFVDRYAMETFLIYDNTHRIALAYEQGRAELVGLEGEFVLDASQTELYYRALWTKFYQTITIRERKNLRCRMSHMPKRYWENMVELKGGAAQNPLLTQ
ncbi:MAG: TIGR03915 family putative DNA repair protein [Clostridia bacterium]|nr:TIGR03915 family putative DNA repair protein [Clostridia bacterium]